jgi:hypothetical protein
MCGQEGVDGDLDTLRLLFPAQFTDAHRSANPRHAHDAIDELFGNDLRVRGSQLAFLNFPL